MKRSLSLVVALLLIALLGCQQAPAPTQPLVLNETALAQRPTATPTPSNTPTPVPPTATSTPSPTVGPSPTPSPTAPPPTATPHPALAGFSYCGGSFGKSADERFSAELQSISVASTDATERLMLSFVPGEGDLHGEIACLLPSAASLIDTDGHAALLRLELRDWEHDERFAASAAVVSAAVPLSGTQVIRSVALRVDPNASAGLIVELGLAEPVPFKASVEDGQIVVDVARMSQPPYGNDALRQSGGKPKPLDEPLFFLADGDIWSLAGAAARPLTRTPELETGLGVSPDGRLLVFCKAHAPEAAELGSLWISNSDGSEMRQLADVGGCADPAFSPDGERVFFVAPLAPTPPFVFQLWTVELESGAAQQISALDEWSRRYPQPLADGSVITVGSADAERSALLLDHPDGASRELSAELLGLGAYTGVGRALLSPDGRSVAVEALRVGGGADLALLGANGKLQSTIGDGYWNRPLAWDHNGTLYYLRAVCASGLILTYEIRALSDGKDELILAGAMGDDIGSATTTEAGLVLVRQPPAHTTPRGPQPEPAGPASLWLLDSSGVRGRLYVSQTPIAMLEP